MNDMNTTTAAEGQSKAEMMRERKAKTARQKFDRLANENIESLDALINHVRETAGILNEEQAGVLHGAVYDRVAALKASLDVHVAAPVKVKGKAEKKRAFSLF